METSILPLPSDARLRRKALGAAALLALLTACGGGGGSGGSSSAGGGATLPPVSTAGITVLAGNPAEQGALDGAGTAARFNYPMGITIDAAGNLYVADRFNFAIRKITPDGQVSTVAGVLGASADVDGAVPAARFQGPSALAFDKAGNLFVTDLLKVRKLTPSGTVSTVTEVGTGNSVDGRSFQLFVPGALALDAAGNLYLSNGIGTRRITPAGDTLMLEGVATLDNTFGTRSFTARGLTLDAAGTAYVFDLRNTVSRAASGSGSLVTIAGTPGTTGTDDGSGAAARFDQIAALTLDNQGNLYAADRTRVRKITPAGVVTTVAGTVGASSVQAGALPGSLDVLGGIVADGKGNLYATSGHAVVKITLP
jgi:sugar lactone lactonase YvrE